MNFTTERTGAPTNPPKLSASMRNPNGVQAIFTAAVRGRQ
jgi:hypothetical protein